MKTAAAVTIASLVGAEAAGSWSIIAPALGSFGSDVVMYDELHGLLPMNSNGIGASVLGTSDGGRTWPTQVAVPNVLLALAGAGYGKTAVVAGPLGDMYSLDGGKTFNTSKGFIQSQGIAVLGSNSGYVAAGYTGLQEQTGAAFSTTGGQTFKDVTISQLQASARYVAAPSKDVIYVSAGNWPDSGAEIGDHYYTHPLTERIHVTHNKAHKTVSMEFRSNSNVTNGYLAQIVKSSDGGKTWVSQYFQPNEFYFNGIDCQDELNCCAVAESDGGAANGANGAYVFCTTDGGAQWKQTFNSPINGASLMDIAAAGPNEYWAVGGVMASQVDFTAWFLHSTDNGATWAIDTSIEGQYGMSATCLGPKCWATTVDLLQTSSVARNF